MLLEAESGKGNAIAIRPGSAITVGRSGPDLAFPQDVAMSRSHFVVQCDEDGRIRVRDLDSANGTYRNGERVSACSLQPGDTLQAGDTRFRLVPEDEAAMMPSDGGLRTEVMPKGAPLDLLRTRKEPLYALLDAARDRRVLDLLRESDEEYQSLYDGQSALDLEAYAPYLVKLPPDSLLLEDLVEEGWGKSWGIYFTCGKPFAEIRTHFRRFLMMEMEGREVYFRFYDPRVLRVYLPTCTREEVGAFFGEIGEFLLEADGDSRQARVLWMRPE